MRASVASLLVAAGLVSAAPAATNTFQVTNFNVSGGWTMRLTNYTFSVALNDGPVTKCLGHSIETVAHESDCGSSSLNAEIATGGINATCDGKQFSFTWNNGSSATKGGSPGFVLGIAHDNGHTVPLHACRFFETDYKCVLNTLNPKDEGFDTDLIAPTSFNLTASTQSQCNFS